MVRHPYQLPYEEVNHLNSGQHLRLLYPKSLEAQEKALEKSAGTAKRTETNTARITSRITNDGLQEDKNATDPGAAMLQKVFGVLRILRDEFSKQREATRSMIGDQQKTIRELEQKLDEYKQEMQETKAQVAEELRQVRGQLDSILKCPAMINSTQTSRAPAQSSNEHIGIHDI
ncbi:hypothetical protein FPOAC1_003904 [Fusarium poae]|uniref:hypothetical protein n=1 Tax=Fusarium poae TaxID=36050 RepID=UPI001CE8C5EB|nr:hypothetical protein FPOAC1_003904 [Fusarium poae]KAG8677876.1 hypothetical protein FPOAC1_003904 [Fusarium poae]